MPTFHLSSAFLLTVGLFLLFAHPAHAFGAGNIASAARIEGSNWRHGDIEDTLLTLVMSRAAGGKNFRKIDVARVYFGNWLRDYSQAIDVGTVKYVSAEAIRILLWVLGFMTFGYGTKEFEVTTERLGCYRPEDHIDNPKDYADNLDAKQYDQRLRGPVDERVELAIDPRTGLKNYIANENVGITTSAGHVRGLFTKSIQLGRSFARSGNKDELHEALRLLGTGCHCLEDWSAHSNYTELALIEMGERDVFPHVGRQTQIRLPGARSAVFPVITGTFGGVDFLHSVMGEFDDKATQSEIEQLENTMANGGNQGDSSLLKELLDKIPSGLFGGDDQAGKADELQANATAAQMQNMRITPKRPEAFTQQMEEVVRQIYPIIEWHDDLMKSISETIEKIPVLPELIEQFEDQLNIFVFGLLAPFVLPIITQLKTELNQGSSEIIQSSKDKQLIVFNDDNCSDPTHSMLSKDHFSNILNEPAGKVASQVLKWAVPQLIQCWDDERVDANRTISRIINGVFHHPALRNVGDDGAADGRKLMFNVVEQWWGHLGSSEKNEYRQKLGREGVKNGENHKEGVEDTGHGCCAPLSMAKQSAGGGAGGGMITDLLSAFSGGSAATNAGSGYGRPTNAGSGFGRPANAVPAELTQGLEEAVGGGALGGLVGALAGGLGGSLLGNVFGSQETQSSSQQYQAPGGGVTQSYTEVAHGGDRYGQAQYQQTQYPGGGQSTDYQRYEQTSQGSTGYGFEQHTETRPTHGGGFEETTERRYQRGNEVKTEGWRDHRKESDSDSDDSHKKRGKHHKNEDYNRQEPSYGRQEPPRQEYGRNESSEYGNRFEEPQREEFGGRGGHGGRGGGFQEPPRQEYSGGYGGGFQEPPRQEYSGGYGGGFQEPPRQEYSGGFGGGFEEPPRQEYEGNNFGEDEERRGGRGGGREYGQRGYGEEEPSEESSRW